MPVIRFLILMARAPENRLQRRSKSKSGGLTEQGEQILGDGGGGTDQAEG